LEDVVVKGQNITFGSLKLPAVQKRRFVELVLLELNQGMQEEWDAARHILNVVAVFFGELGGMGFEPSFCLMLGNIRQDSLKNCVDIPGSFLH
jgi:hypothetical protein